MKKVIKYLPGMAIALVLAAAAKGLETLESAAGLHFIGASVIALFLGMIINHFRKPTAATAPGIKFTSKKILKFAIILLGASLNIRTVLSVGRPRVFDRKGAGAELENEQPHRRGHGHLRRQRHRGHRAGHRRDGHGYRLRHVGNVPV